MKVDRGLNRIVGVSILLTLLAMPAGAAAAGATTSPPPPPPCEGAPSHLPPGPAPGAAHRSTITAAGNQAATIGLGHDRAENDADVRFTVKGPMPKLPIGAHLNAKGLKRQGGKGRIPTDAVGLMEEVQGDSLVVNVCINPALHHLNPGVYSGTVVIDDPRLAGPAFTTIGATVQYEHLWLLLFVGAGLMVLVSVAGVSLTGSLTIPRSRPGLRAAVPIVATVGAAVVAAVSVWYSRAYQQPTFGAELIPAVVGLLVAMLTAGFSAGHLGNFFGSRGQSAASPADPPPAGAADTPASPAPAPASV